MEITVKGEKKSYGKKTLTIDELLKIEDVDMPQYVSVEVNSEIVNRKNFEATKLKNGDNIEFLYFMGGGK